MVAKLVAESSSDSLSSDKMLEPGTEGWSEIADRLAGIHSAVIFTMDEPSDVMQVHQFPRLRPPERIAQACNFVLVAIRVKTPAHHKDLFLG